MALQGLYLPVNAPWTAELKRECLTFPAGKHDDQVDALGLVGQLLDHIIAGQKPQPEKKTRWDYQGLDNGTIMIGEVPIRELIDRAERRRRMGEG